MDQTGLPVSLGTDNIKDLLKRFSLPAIVAMTASSLYNITDSIFIGHGVGALAISGLAITFPLMNLAAAFGSLVGVGAATLMSVRLGQKDYTSANHILGNVIVLNLIFGLTFTIITMFFLNPILYFFGASPDTLSYARDYMEVILLGNVITHMYMGLNALLRSIGLPRKAMLATIYSVFINIVLTAFCIFVLDWGIRGSAIATVMSQGIMLGWQFKLFSNKKSFIHLKKGIFSLKRRIAFDSLSIGMAPFLMNAAACVIVIILNQSLIRHGGDMAVGAYGIVNRVAMLLIMIIIGLNQGAQPIMGYNYGAKLYSRVNDVLKLTIIMATGILTAGFLLGQLFPKTIASIFTSDPELIGLAATGLRIVLLFYPVIGVLMVSSTFFQSIGMAGKAIFISLSRQVLFLLPCLLVLPGFFGVKGVWASMPAADLLSSVVAAYMLVRQYRAFKNKS